MAPAEVQVSVVFSPRAGVVDEVVLYLPVGSTVADAVRASGMQARHPEHELSSLPVGLWGAFCERDDVLRDHDRVELYRPLRVDPKEARRQRQQAQRGARRSG